MRLKPETAKLLIEKSELNMSKKFTYKGKSFALETIILETLKKLVNYNSR